MAVRRTNSEVAVAHLPEEFVELAREVNNWGRWGDDDQRGTLNLVTPDAVRRGVDAVRHGQPFPLAIPLSPDGIQAGLVPGRDNPTHEVTQVNEPMMPGSPFDASDDRVSLATQAATHWDALAHVSYDGRLYNGRPASRTGADGARWGGIDRVGPIVGRGVLLDVARALGRDRLDPGHHVTPEDLDAAVEHARVAIEPGDLLLLRTGQIRLAKAGDRTAYGFPSPGPVMRTVRWFHRHDLAAVATDTLAFEAFPGDPEDLPLPVHALDLVEMGLTQGQNFDLEALAEACAEDGRHTFLLAATPEPVEHGLGAPVAPVAVR